MRLAPDERTDDSNTLRFGAITPSTSALTTHRIAECAIEHAYCFRSAKSETERGEKPKGWVKLAAASFPGHNISLMETFSCSDPFGLGRKDRFEIEQQE